VSSPRPHPLCNRQVPWWEKVRAAELTFPDRQYSGSSMSSNLSNLSNPAVPRIPPRHQLSLPTPTSSPPTAEPYFGHFPAFGSHKLESQPSQSYTTGTSPSASRMPLWALGQYPQEFEWAGGARSNVGGAGVAPHKWEREGLRSPEEGMASFKGHWY
jgi:hypothetical protein